MIVTIQDFKRRFKVNWMTLLVGWRGFGAYQRLVLVSDIQQFAIENLDVVSKSNTVLPDLATLATISRKEDYQIEPLLDKLSAAEHNVFEIEVRKWVICLLEKQLQELPSNYVDGLITLTEFWCSLQYPEYSPHRIQGKDNMLTPQQYYTLENYKVILQQHKDWIGNELQRLSDKI